ncbi:indole-3-glycerol phosphate synthase TrpC [Alkalicoccus urumqiensis]|uniref:Indole-3-glycerol phosphate synthase n=1 Tax=Alkalicoccus urumqiensis TaxID=1548213 RepID=A0A2P6ML18_ALKUR|nr:indole-3-glycerol phosphate synthase TrpC [Alkalicoccus urumqiensis]PRO66978.1 indole-3-glycerol phosphate synthase TrpC [Alkalicoccus urumqiensis]
MLDKITDRKKEEIASLIVPETHLIEGTKRSLAESLRASSYPLGLIAEVKKASPSKGVILEDFHPTAIAEEYEKLQVSGISVLTDRDFFQGAPEYLTSIRRSVKTPILRKDFIIDPVQVLEADRIGADAILLIAAILDPEQLKELYLQAEELGMEALVEVHSEEELEQVLRVLTPGLIGVNNRDLRTFETDLTISKRLAPMMPESSLFVSESGVHTKADADYLKNHGARGLLIGEGFMKSSDRRQFLESLFGDES